MELVEEHDLRLVSRWHCHNAPVRFHLHFRPSIEDPLDDMFKAMTFVSSVKERVVYISLEDEGQNKVQITTGDMNACVRRRWFDPTSPPPCSGEVLFPLCQPYGPEPVELRQSQGSPYRRAKMRRVGG